MDTIVANGAITEISSCLIKCKLHMWDAPCTENENDCYWHNNLPEMHRSSALNKNYHEKCFLSKK